MHITISTAYNGQHKDWLIYQEALDDQVVFDDQFRELEEYLDEADGRVDSGGLISEQVKEVILEFAEGKRDRPWNATLAVNDTDDMDVFVKAEREDDE